VKLKKGALRALRHNTDTQSDDVLDTGALAGDRGLDGRVEPVIR
jgi:hypothetical protein